MSKSALIIGATGATGKHLLAAVLASPHYTRVGEYGRRITPADQLGGAPPAKLEQRTVDFERIADAGLKDGRWDVVFITLGTTRAAAGSAAAFEKIDREYVINTARAAKTDDPAHQQRLVYLSSGGASASSPFPYLKSKGLTENALAALGYSDTIIFQPGFLANAQRSQSRLAETIFMPIATAVSYLNANAAIDVALLGKSMALAGHLGSGSLPPAAGPTKSGPAGAQFTVILNKGAAALGKTGA